MSDQDEKDALQRRAIRAAKAVTLGAAFVGTTACSGPAPDDSGWEFEPDGGGPDDVAADTSRDTGPDTRADTSQDTEPTCSTMKDGTCPNTCDMSNDADCCEQSGGIWSGGNNGACAVPGPFVPPAMPTSMA